MDQFEVYLFDKINEFRKRINDNNGNDEVLWLLNSCLEEFMEILSEYNLNYKYELEA